MHGPGIQPSGQDSSFGPCPDMVSDGRGAECSVLVIGDAPAGGGWWGSILDINSSRSARGSSIMARARSNEARGSLFIYQYILSLYLGGKIREVLFTDICPGMREDYRTAGPQASSRKKKKHLTSMGPENPKMRNRIVASRRCPKYVRRSDLANRGVIHGRQSQASGEAR